HYYPVLVSSSLQCYVCHRDLHSFPTRRSSDLQRLWLSRRARWSDGLGRRRGCRGDPSTSFATDRALRRALATGDADRTPGWREQDRKSTRLNSSHVKISYAVFCLKKKNKRIN